MFRWFNYTYLGAWLAAKRDAKRGLPRSDEDSHYEGEWKKHAKAIFERIAREWEELDKRLKPEFCAAKARLMTANARLQQEKEDYQEVRGKFEKHEEPYVHRLMGLRAYKVLITFIAIAEIPMTVIVFRVTGESEILTWIMAAALCIGIPFASDKMGKILKHKPFKYGDKTLQYQTIVLSVSVLIVLISMGFVRKTMFESEQISETPGIETGLDSPSSSVDTIYESKFEEAVGVEMSPLGFAMAFAGINLFIFIITSIASYHAHDVDPKTSEALWRFKKLKRNLEEEEEEYQNARDEHERALANLNEIAEHRRNIFEIKQREIEEYKNLVLSYIEHYRKTNIRYRIKYGKYVPSPAFREPVIETPSVMTELDEECPELGTNYQAKKAQITDSRQGGEQK